VLAPLLLAVVLAGQRAAAVPTCVPNPQVEALVHSLGRDDRHHISTLEKLEEQPRVAVCHLTRALRVVADTHVPLDQQHRRQQTMNVVWAIRGLRYLNGCKDVRAPTRQDTSRWSGDRRWFLLGQRDRGGVTATEMSFFATWMSRDNVFIAPVDAQKIIIQRWRDSYVSSGERHRYATCADINHWYF
jgi:hypothetical protein